LKHLTIQNFEFYETQDASTDFDFFKI